MHRLHRLGSSLAHLCVGVVLAIASSLAKVYNELIVVQRYNLCVDQTPNLHIISSQNKKKYSKLIFRLNTLYKSIYKSISNRGIGVLLTAVLCIVFAGVWIPDSAIKYGARVFIWCFYTLSEQPTVYWFVPLVGFAGISPDKARQCIDIIIEYLRVSGQEQSKKHGKERQKDAIQDEIDNIDSEEVIPISKDWESASTMLRENIDAIVETVRSHPDKTVGLMIEDVDRLSRAPPFEAAVFLWVLSRFDVVFYFGNWGYFDFSDPYQQLIIFHALVGSRDEYNSIIERTSSGQKGVKEAGGFPGKAPFGYSKPTADDETNDNNHSNKLEINEQQAEVITQAVDEILATEDPVVQSIYDDLSDEAELEDFPEYGSFFSILRNEKYTGDLEHDDEIVGQIPQIISDEEYKRVINKIGKPDNSENDDLDHSLRSIIERFGIDGSIQLFDIIKGRCPKCGGDVDTKGSDTRWGHRVLNYECIGAATNSQEAIDDECEDSGETDTDGADVDDNEATADGCEFSGPLLNEPFLQQWEPGLPIVCPRCQTPADEDDWSKSDGKISAVEQTCDACGLWYSADVNTEYDSVIERGMDHSDHAIRWFDDTNRDSEDTDSQDEQSTDSVDTDSDSTQGNFDDFE